MPMGYFAPKSTKFSPYVNYCCPLGLGVCPELSVILVRMAHNLENLDASLVVSSYLVFANNVFPCNIVFSSIKLIKWCKTLKGYFVMFVKNLVKSELSGLGEVLMAGIFRSVTVEWHVTHVLYLLCIIYI